MSGGTGVPVLVVSGFLGSGKTSLVRHLLAEAGREGVRMAVVSNELGELGVDAALLARADEDYVELAGGCVCCKLSGQLVETLQALWERSRPDRIVVETSGVALPFDTQLNFWREPVRRWITDDVAIVVVNAEQLRDAEAPGTTFEQQVSSADLLLLNQIDRVPEAALPALEARLREIEPEAPILRTLRGAVASDLLFPPDPEGLRARRRATRAAPSPHVHEPFTAEELRVADGASEAEVRERLRGRGALRAKGFVRTRDGLRLVQGVGARLELTTPDTPPPAGLVGRIVVIRRGAGAPPAAGRGGAGPAPSGP